MMSLAGVDTWTGVPMLSLVKVLVTFATTGRLDNVQIQQFVCEYAA